MRVGKGIFCWSGIERQTRRYGAFYLGDATFSNTVKVTPSLKVAQLERLRGRRVQVFATVVEVRKSGHVGDAFLGLKPKTPKVGQTIDLGVGVLDLGTLSYDKFTTIVLRPEPLRRELWLDPRKLFRLHDQTVELDVSPTDAECSPAPDLEFAPEGAIVNGDGTFQFSGVDPETVAAVRPRRPPRIESLGDGLFSISVESPKIGERLTLIKKH
jgi:hypothetical protein